MQTPTAADDDGILLPFERLDPSRRSFLRLAGFGVAAALLEGCSRTPASQLVVPAYGDEGVVPGRAYRLATVCDACPAGCGMLATCKDGRPVKLEGLPGHPSSKGGLCAVGQADLLALYDSKRFAGPRRGTLASTWGETDPAVGAALDAVRKQGGRVRILTGTRHGPSESAAIARFLATFKDGRHVVYDALSASAVLDAHLATHGVRALPRYVFDRAETTVSFESDELATWVSPVEFAAGFAEGRRRGFDGRRPRRWQFEARVSPTGDAADERRMLAPWEVSAAVVALRDAVAAKAAGVPVAVPDDAPQAAALRRAADDLWASRGRSLVVCGRNDVALQTVVNDINERLGAYGSTLDLARPSRCRTGSDGAAETLRAELEAGQVDVLVVAGCNPVYDLPGADRLGGAIREAKLLISAAAAPDETAVLADWTCPEPHALESWGDAEPVQGLFSVRQPTIPPLRDARTLRATLSRWSGDERSDRDLVRETWATQVYPQVPGDPTFDRFYRRALTQGFVQTAEPPSRSPQFRPEGVRRPAPEPAPAEGALGVLLYASTALSDGRHAHNAWLQELPDPVTRVAWDNYASLAPSTAARLGFVDGDVVRFSAEDGAAPLELPVRIQPGQHPGVVAAALGYGRLGTDRFSSFDPTWWEGRATVGQGGVVGVAVASWLRSVDGAVRNDARTTRLSATGRRLELASVQDHHSLEIPPALAPPGGEVRDVARSITVAESAHAGAHHAGKEPSLWPDDHATTGRSWAMTVDLDLCTGCAACVVACQAENNIPTVGRDEVLRHREMSWIRIDRYASGDGDDLETIRQPMMCQHCANAPCEAVCPVLATVHSAEGLNQQVYNRCVGTRYCANTCPYKTRRFNWFDYPSHGELENHALNPDVTVRTRGVMEKCTLCVQRIEEGKAEARRAGRPLRDGEIRTACQQSCPTQAVVFGDIRDPTSVVARQARDGRSYRALEELNVAPAVRYLSRVRNPAGKG